MINRILLLTILTWSMSRCEPPVNSYLPPSSGSSQPSPQYGPPVNNGRGPSSSPGRGSVQNEQNQFQNSGRSGAPNNQYGSPSSNSKNQPESSGFGGAPQGRTGQKQPNSQSTQFGGSNEGLSGRLSSAASGFGRGSGRNGRLETSYGPPPTGDFQSRSGVSERYPNNQQQGLQSNIDFKDSSNGFSSQGNSPSALYGAPGFGNNVGGSRSGQLRNQNDRYDVEDSKEPAKYEFSYEVDDEQTGTKFGHSEQRDGDLATGQYNVVLPDGRKQVVEYEAGLQGYTPQIRYEGLTGGQGGIRGFQQGGSNSLTGGDRGNGFGSEDSSPSRYQEASSFSLVDANQGEGYPSGGPGGNGANGFGGKGVGSSGPNNGNDRGAPNAAANGGYPSGGPRNGGSVSSQNSSQGRGNGYPSGRPQNGGGFSNGEEGYPSGGPNGARGSGY